MLKDRITFQCNECGEETVFLVPKGQDLDIFVDDKECPECGCTCLEVSDD